MSYAALLFDMDGVIIDTRPYVTTFWRRLAAQHGVRLTEADFQRDIYGCPMVYTLNLFFPRLDPQAVSRHLDAYELNLAYHEIPGATAFLKACQQAGIPTALVTSANRLKVGVVLKQLGLEDLFTTRVTVEDIRRGKPYPDCYALAAQRLGLPPEQCVVFEDAVSGIKAGAAAGARCIGILPPDEAPALREAGAWHVVPNFTEVRLQAAPPAGLRLQLGPAVSLPLTLRVYAA
jgi:mannitol-1-/sugar-/sorbitol-6-phosphatase